MIDKTNYIERLKLFEDFIDFAIEISNKVANIHVPWHIVRASQLYTRLTMTSLSIVHLLPENNIFPFKWEYWDFFSVASLTRNLVENYHMFFYIGIDHVTEEERDFRLKLLYYHWNNEKYKLYSDLRANIILLREFENNLPITKESLKNHAFFQSLDRRKKDKILSGNSAMYLTNKEISERISFNTEEFSSLYRLFSNHTHSSPFAFFTMSNERGRGEENEAELAYISIALDVCIKYLSAAIIDMINLFPEALRDLDNEKRRLINQELNGFSD